MTHKLCCDTLTACLAQQDKCLASDRRDSCELRQVGQCLLQSSAPHRSAPRYDSGGGPFEQGLYAPAANRQLLRTLGSEYTIGRDSIDETSEDGGGYDYGEFPGQLE